ncbi:trypsin alpha-like [Drosophila ficusphila]|uniref:trypsin alpha-like n=1 Tax=Drosophila ficusphila TaxID=30025 RepID=UPI0007E7FD12|nr:trypsin alpha-like [Drosophila ficusphila]
MFIKSFLLLLAFNYLSAEPEPSQRIVGGGPIDIEEAPWQVSLQLNGKHSCGGSIYSKDIIITAAHCRFVISTGQQIEAEDFTIRVGSTITFSEGTIVKVAAIKSHESFKLGPNSNDIAVMRLAEPLEFSKDVQPIPLAKYNPMPGSFAWTTGWGATLIHPHGPVYLQGVCVRIQRPEMCRYDMVHDMTEDLICAGEDGGGACGGDSGGPLVVDRKLVGVVSGGPSDCLSSTRYISVPYMHNWILNAVKSI